MVFDAHGSLATRSESLSGYEPSLVTAASISVLGALAALGIRRQRRTAMTEPVAGPVAEESATV